MVYFRPNLVENHLALLLAAWLEAGILDVSNGIRLEAGILDFSCITVIAWHITGGLVKTYILDANRTVFTHL